MNIPVDNHTILLVDDEPGICKVLCISLTDMGYTVHTANDGDEALRIFSKQNPAIVMTDIKMPGMDGIDLLKKIKEKRPETEVIMITGHGEMDLAIMSLKYEATDFITKPIHPDTLEIALKRAEERISLKRQLREYTENLEGLVEEKTRELIAAERLAAVGQTVAGLSHAIKNIASGLGCGAFVLEKGIELDEKKYLDQGWQMVKNNVDKIKHLSLDLLNYAKPSAIELKTCDPNLPAREVADLMSAKANEMGVLLETQICSDLKSFAFDPDGIHRCLLNLVSNALDACAECGASRHPRKIVIKTQKSKGWAVEYRVEDNCGGMDETVKDSLFQSFFSTKGKMGTGIGLMLTKKIVGEHNGVIDVETRENEGSLFIIRLPLNKS
ncbi:MAG TPA: response regulator [Deltaproteobacteria bacterium]|nr:response regulator [Deltaproteobacteria bacterium]